MRKHSFLIFLAMTEREGVLFDLWSHLPPEMQFRVVSFLDPFVRLTPRPQTQLCSP